jgi:hypothetical protein
MTICLQSGTRPSAMSTCEGAGWDGAHGPKSMSRQGWVGPSADSFGATGRWKGNGNSQTATSIRRVVPSFQSLPHPGFHRLLAFDALCSFAVAAVQCPDDQHRTPISTRSQYRNVRVTLCRRVMNRAVAELRELSVAKTSFQGPCLDESLTPQSAFPRRASVPAPWQYAADASDQPLASHS